MNQPAITLFVTGYCPYCRRAKALLAEKGLAFTEIDVEGDQQLREQMALRSGGVRTVPQIFIGEKHIGGCDDLVELDRRGELDRIIRGNR